MMRKPTRAGLEHLSRVLILIALPVLASVFMAATDIHVRGVLGWGAWGLLMVVIFFHDQIKSLIGSLYTLVRPGRVNEWRGAPPPSGSRSRSADIGILASDDDVALFRLSGVPLVEAQRMGTWMVWDYWYGRLVEARTGLRFGTEPLTYLNVSQLRTLVRTTRWPGWFPRVGVRVFFIRRDLLRALAIICSAIADDGKPLVRRLSALQPGASTVTVGRDYPDSGDLIGWLLAWPAVIADKVVPSGTEIGAVRALYPDQRGLAGWLLAMAGIRPGEPVPDAATEESLRMLATLRGHRVGLVDMASGKAGLPDGQRVR